MPQTDPAALRRGQTDWPAAPRGRRDNLGAGVSAALAAASTSPPPPHDAPRTSATGSTGPTAAASGQPPAVEIGRVEIHFAAPPLSPATRGTGPPSLEVLLARGRGR